MDRLRFFPLLLALAALLALATTPAAGAGPTDIRRVDEFIDAPRVLLGDTEAAVLRALGPPTSRDTRHRPTFRDPAVRREVHRLAYPEIAVDIHEARLVGIVLTAAAYPLPWGLTIGASRAAVEEILGEAQGVTDSRLLYLYSDGFPKTVVFSFEDGRISRITWEYWVE